MLINLWSALLVEIVLIVKAIGSCIRIGIHFLEILTLRIFLSWVITIASILQGNWISSGTMFRADLSLSVVLHELVRMLLQWSTLDLTFSKFFSWPYSSCWYSFHWDWSFSSKNRPTASCVIIISVEVVEEKISVFMVRVQMINYFLFLIDTNSYTTLAIENVFSLISVKVLSLWSDLNY